MLKSYLGVLNACSTNSLNFSLNNLPKISPLTYETSSKMFGTEAHWNGKILATLRQYLRKIRGNMESSEIMKQLEYLKPRLILVHLQMFVRKHFSASIVCSYTRYTRRHRRVLRILLILEYMEFRFIMRAKQIIAETRDIREIHGIRDSIFLISWNSVRFHSSIALPKAQTEKTLQPRRGKCWEIYKLNLYIYMHTH